MRLCLWRVGSTKDGKSTLPDNCRKKGCNGAFAKRKPNCKMFLDVAPNICAALLLYEEKHGSNMLKEASGIQNRNKQSKKGPKK